MSLITKLATLKHDDGRVQNLTLVRKGKSSYQWYIGEKRWDEADYVAPGDAIKGLRVWAETDVAAIGIDLTFYEPVPTPAQRTAKRIMADITPYLKAPGGPTSEAELADLIEEEMHFSELLEHVQVLLAFCFQRRRAYAQALFPSKDGTTPRDVTADGLLLNCIEAVEKSAGIDLSNLTKILREPVGRIQVVTNVPTPKGPVN